MSSLLKCSVHSFGAFLDIGWKRDALLRNSEVYQYGVCDPNMEFILGEKVSEYPWRWICVFEALLIHIKF